MENFVKYCKDYILEHLDEYKDVSIYMCDVPYDTEVNDFLWFERDMIAEHLGYSDWDEYEYGTNEEEED